MSEVSSVAQIGPWPWPRLVAHRGGGSLAPENTIGALRVGLQYGYRAVELDAMLPADDIAVLMHDPKFGRTVRGAGRVIDRSAHELVQLDAGAWHSPAFVGERVPLLKDALQFCRTHSIWPNIEIKPVPGHEERTGRIVAREIAAFYADAIRPGGDRAEKIDRRVPLLSSFSETALDAARREAPDVPRGLLVDVVAPDWRSALDRLGCASLHANHANVTRETVQQVKAGGFWLFCFTVNKLHRAREILEWGVDAFCTDRIDRIAPDLAGQPRTE